MNKNYYSAIDGLRAFCFLLVLLFHCKITGFNLGWSGVTIFFVISGFLITEILIKSKESQSYFKSFYMRRILRIFPIYFIVIIGATFIFIVMKHTFPRDILYHATYTQNIFWVISNYVSDLQPLLAHTWSLAIEEQFYLIWPLLIWIVPKKHLSRLCSVIILFAIAFRIIMVLYIKNEYATSILLFSQIDTLALGSLLACYKQDIANSKVAHFFIKNSLFAGFIGILLTITYIGFSNKTNLFNAYNMLRNTENYLNNIFTSQIYIFITMFAVGIIRICYSNQGFLPKILSNKFLIHIGKISYGLYLYHWVVIAIMKKIIPSLFGSVIFVIIVFALTYLISVVSFNTIEKYFNSLKNKFSYNQHTDIHLSPNQHTT